MMEQFGLYWDKNRWRILHAGTSELIGRSGVPLSWWYMSVLLGYVGLCYVLVR